MRAVFVIALAALALLAIYFISLSNERPEGAPPETTAASTPAPSEEAGPSIGLIDDARIENAESEPGNWLAY